MQILCSKKLYFEKFPKWLVDLQKKLPKWFYKNLFDLNCMHAFLKCICKKSTLKCNLTCIFKMHLRFNGCPTLFIVHQRYISSHIFNHRYFMLHQRYLTFLNHYLSCFILSKAFYGYFANLKWLLLFVPVLSNAVTLNSLSVLYFSASY